MCVRERAYSCSCTYACMHVCLAFVYFVCGDVYMRVRVCVYVCVCVCTCVSDSISIAGVFSRECVCARVYVCASRANASMHM